MNEYVHGLHSIMTIDTKIESNKKDLWTFTAKIQCSLKKVNKCNEVVI